MDPRHFDDLVKRLAVGTTRRNALKVFGGAITAGTLGRLRLSGADAADKVGICHLTGSATNPVVFITVSTNAIPAHKAHGDVINPNFETDPANCGGCLISCDDGDPCTIDTCVAGACVHTPVDCSALDDQCLLGVCVDGTCEAQAANEGLGCDDDNACTTNDTCVAGVCTGGPALVCDDANECTSDTCDPVSGCVYTPLTGTPCDGGVGTCLDGTCCSPGGACSVDDDCCTEGETCVGGTCQTPCVGGGTCSDDTDCCGEETCVAGICSLAICEGRTCGNFLACTDDPECLCFVEVGGAGVCGNGFQCQCGVTCQTCETSAECGAGSVCVVNSCCGAGGVCIPICTAGVTLAPQSIVDGPTGPTPGSK